jgi:hypothetical protein
MKKTLEPTNKDDEKKLCEKTTMLIFQILTDVDEDPRPSKDDEVTAMSENHYLQSVDRKRVCCVLLTRKMTSRWVLIG